MQTFVLLLRGVMPTGRNKVPMIELRKTLEAAGYSNVRTYIQSGNVVLQSNSDSSVIQKQVHDIIAQEMGADISVIARTPEQIKNILEGNPFSLEDSARTYFSMLESTPTGSLVEEFQRITFVPDTVAIIDSTIYTLYSTKYSDSKFNNNFYERKLKVVATTRNFNTLSRLLGMST
ncbi:MULTISPECIES: DUF1697 domain-containing protein [unclassified Serratia (in: enterobacteria)]|uniref:DUF1697 domain-containing protein n=1 Tax=unclassified Serratia (in: enterobacteria) TaxID=2647522 RepID=UPI000505BC7C|nr:MULTISPECIES: DUF1697 domain-containing protein [unclassified Serratia (in: enterobacteria)]KFK91672.1 hypothetical protein JV45_25045 [Serratia sp. Ag2]KFK92216.1 hypothetical protein IV04_24865 [Serratia sp. Ag1]